MVKEYLDDFARSAQADELIVAHAAPTIEARLHSADLLADVAGLVPRIVADSGRECLDV